MIVPSTIVRQVKVMAVDFEYKESYTAQDLVSIVALLRAPGGCPWDREQTHESIKKNFIEETYEVIEAINQQNIDGLKEELGDILLQVALHCQMEQENGSFNFDDVVNDIVQKLIIRHPHVFAQADAQDTAQALSNWDAIKLQTKGMKSQSESMLSVPRELPALMRAQKIQHKAAKVGFDWNDVNGAMDKLYEEIDELKSALAQNDKANIDEEFGDVLFSCVNIARFIDVDSEESLTLATDKFLNRFSIVEKLAKQENIDMSQASLEELDLLWDKAKILLNK